MKTTVTMNIPLTIIILLLITLSLLLNYVRLQKQQLLKYQQELEHITRLIETTHLGKPGQANLSPQDRLQLMEAMLQAIPNPIFYKDRFGCYQGCNKAFEQAIGRSKEEVIGKTVFELRSPEYANIHHEEDLKLLSHPGIRVYETAGEYADGKDHHVIIHKATYTNTADEVIGIVGILTDITERKQLEQTLKNSEEQFRCLFEYSDDPCLLLDDGLFVACNRAAINMLRYSSKEQLLQKSPVAISPEFQPDGRRSKEKAIELTEQAFQKGSLRFEWVHCRTNGEEFYADVLLTVIPMHNKPILYTVWRDLTERKYTETILQQRTKKLQLIHRISQLFNSTLEWKKVLQTVLGELQHLLEITGTSCWLKNSTGELICQHAEGPGSDKVIGFCLPKTQGIASFVARTGQSLIVSDTLVDKRHFKEIDKQIGISLRSILSLPLLNQGLVIGVLNLVDTRIGRFTQEDLNLLEPIAAAAANAIDNARLYTQVQQELRDRQRAEETLAKREAYLAALVEIQRRLLAFGSSHQKPERIASLTPNSDNFPYLDILERLGPVSQANRVYILATHHNFLEQNNTHHQLSMSLRGEWWTPETAPQASHSLWRIEELPRWIKNLKKGETIAGQATDFPESEQRCLDSYGIRSILVLPLLVNGNFFGLIGFENDIKAHCWESSEIALLQVAAAAISLAKEHQHAHLKLQQAKATAEEARQAAEMANRTKSAFLAQMSHELRTPLNGILGYTQLFGQDNNLTHLQQQGIHVIHRCGEHLLTLINDILDFSKMEAGKLELNPTIVSLADFCRDIVDLFKLRAEQKGLTFVYQPLTTLPTRIAVDAKRLRQILLNLLSNAVKFTSQGQVTLTVHYHQSVTRFAIADTGVGIATNQLEAIFLPFHQVGDKNSQAEGTGLGLSISKNLVELMNGQLQVHSQPGQGSLFWFEIALPELSYPLTISSPVADRTASGFKNVNPQAIKILVVDDLQESRVLLVNFLGGRGFHVREAENGATALQLALNDLPDLIITDLAMPVMDGLELTCQLRNTEKLTGVPIFAFSANTLDSSRQNSLDAGCNEFLAKPIDLDLLFNLLPKYLPLKFQTDVDKTFPNLTSSPMTLPSQKQVAGLLQAVALGDIDELMKQIIELEQQDTILSSFLAQVKQLTENFEIDKLEIFLKRTIENRE